jgi:hypothetical protein
MICFGCKEPVRWYERKANKNRNHRRCWMAWVSGQAWRGELETRYTQDMKESAITEAWGEVADVFNRVAGKNLA